MNAPYTRAFSFSGFQSNRPNLPLPGQRVDIELDNIAQAMGSLVSGLAANGPLKPTPPGTLLANLTSSTAIPTAVTVGALKGSLGLGTAASLNVGEPGGVAAYNDPRFGSNADVSGFLTKAGNLAGLTDLPTARQNLGLGTAATRPVGISGGVAAYDDPRFGQGGGGVQIPTMYVSVAAFAKDSDGELKWDNAYKAASAALPITGGVLEWPAGKLTLKNKIYEEFPKGSQQARTITNRGQGTDATILYWPNADGGIQYDFSYFAHSAHISDMTLSTGYDSPTGSGSAYRLNVTSQFYSAGFRHPPYNTIFRVVTRGDDAPFNQKYWNKGIDIRGATIVDIGFVVCAGGSTAGENTGPLGDGISIEGATFGGDFSYTVLVNIANFQFVSLDRGLYYGDFIQGVSAVNGNAVYCRAGMATVDNAARKGVLAQLYVENFQYGIGTGTGIEILTELFTFAAVNCTFFTKRNLAGIKIDHPVPFQISNCWFQGEAYREPPGTAVPPGSNGLIIGPALIPGGIVTGCVFNALAAGLLLQEGSSGITVDACRFRTNAVNVVDLGSRNNFGIANSAEDGTLPPATLPELSGAAGTGSRAFRLRSISDGGASLYTNFVQDKAGNLLVNQATGGGAPRAGLFKFDDQVQLAVGSNFASARHNGASLPANTATNVTWATIEDTGGYRNAGAQGRFIAPAAGLYTFTASVRFDTTSAGTLRQILVLKNGASADLPSDTRAPAGGGASTQCNLSCTVRLNAGDYLTVQAYSDVACSTVGGTGYASMMRVS
ncbi:hypothetical protein BHAOGJBA_4292 [Methylobacterium hispanicum]|uniref:C1q domain-containing protein n=1 Tax=Methylobacterium hispanicum TaxID=270350 RepID=A0AAV4ZT56_9HYPH|nr:hypothetical protein [Methylobacterium hispanicum]GJD90750.1 hypothetical protein BHAOGJBA_4292 [Methylobacterium hispanicum]